MYGRKQRGKKKLKIAFTFEIQRLQQEEENFEKVWNYTQKKSRNSNGKGKP